MHIDLFLHPAPLNRESLENKAIVVIDVLRFCTTVCTALRAGARGVIPTDGPGEAGEMRVKIGADMALVAGERNGVKLESFKFGNSPLEFTADSVGGKYLIMTTTNGTGIFTRAYKANPVLACALVNISKVADRIAREKRDLIIVCSGHEGSFSIEDTICGGMLIHLLMNRHGKDITVNDAGSLALLLFESNREAIGQTIAQGEHARFLTSIGFGRDVEVSSEIDAVPVLPVLKDGRLVLEEN
ncbi:MAG: 2-phosphosulfolactate phosphatase [bacterium]|nr:2-phosphosulfolactate phosphatase [bacterium]